MGVDHFEYGRHRYPFFREAFHLAYTEPREERQTALFDRGAGRAHLRSRAARKNRHWITDGLVKRAGRGSKRTSSSPATVGETCAISRYTWFDQVKLEAQFGRVAIFSVPEAPAPPPSPERSLNFDRRSTAAGGAGRAPNTMATMGAEPPPPGSGR